MITMERFSLPLLLIIVANCGVSYGENHYCVAADTNQNCSVNNHSNSECHTLSEYLENATYYFSSNTNFIFLAGIHIATIPLTVRKISKLSLSGQGPNNSIINCTKNVSLTFVNVNILILEKLSIVSCGIVLGGHTHPALALRSCRNVTLYQLIVSNSTGQGLYAKNVFENFFIRDSTFAFSKGNDVYGGNSISYSANCTQGSKLQIVNTAFHHNTARSQFGNCSAGGLSFVISCTDVQVVMDNVSMSENAGNYGGNLAIAFYNVSQSLTAQFVLKNSLINNGFADDGGAVFILIFNRMTSKPSFISPTNHTTAFLHVHNCSFTNNTATYVGGALYIRQLESFFNQGTTIIIENSTFISNSLHIGHGGTAIHSVNYPVAAYLDHTPQFQTQLKECYFENNFLYKNDWNNSGSGVVFAKFNPYFRISNVTITSNECSGIVAINSNLVFGGNVNISNNKASSGGGLLLCQNSLIYLTPQTKIDITNNTALHVGGGICVESECLQSKPPCFFQMSLTTSTNPSLYLEGIQINIMHNTAGYAGDGLYGGSVDYCFLIYSPYHNKSDSINSINMFNKVFTFHQPTLSNVTSAPQKVCFCRNNQPQCSKSIPTSSHYPGETFIVNIAAIGQLNGTVPGPVLAEPLDTTTTSIEESQAVQRIVNSTCQPLKYTVYSNHNSATLSLSVLLTDDISVIEHLESYQKLNLSIRLKKCPLGFEQSNETRGCVCANVFDSDVKCNITAQVITRPPPSWIGHHFGQVVYHRHCPFDYCKVTDVNITVDENSENSTAQDAQCDHNRTNILCGSCHEGLSAVFGTSNCLQCTNNYLALLTLFALLGILLVFILTALNLTVTGGTLHGLFFYANVVQINSPVFFPIQRSSSYTTVLKVFISWLNLDFGIETCFYDGMDAYAKAWLQFAFPFYILCLSGAIVYLCRKSTFVVKLAGKNAVKVLATLVLLAYAKLLRAVIVGVSYVYLDTNGSRIIVWLSDGNLTYLQGRHIPLFIFSVITGICCLPFAFSLLFIQQLQKYSHIKIFFCIRRLKPFFDAYCGVYTNRGQFWTGLLLLFRIILFTNYAINIVGDPNSNFAFGIGACLLMIIFSWLVRPGIYKLWILDTIESLLHLNLGMLCLIAIQYPKSLASTTNISVSISLLLFLVIVFYHLWKKLKKLSPFKWLLQYNMKTNATTASIPQFDQEREPLLVDF